MKILHVILSSGFAGSERSTAESCNSQLAAGHQLGLVVRRGHRGPTGASVLDHVDQAVRRFEVPNLFFSRRALARAIREFKPDVIAQGDGSDSFGDVNQLQALRECYPGATYLHRGRSYEGV